VSVDFTIRRDDLKQAIKQLQANRGRDARTDAVNVLVSEYAVTFRAVGTEVEYPVHGISPGSAKLPLPVLDRICGMRTGKELQLHISEGVIVCGAATVRHEGISLGFIPDQSISVPLDASVFDLLAIGKILGKDMAQEQGLASRIKKAQGQREEALRLAAGHLEPYGVTSEQLEDLIEQALEAAEPKIRAALVS